MRHFKQDLKVKASKTQGTVESYECLKVPWSLNSFGTV